MSSQPQLAFQISPERQAAYAATRNYVAVAAPILQTKFEGMPIAPEDQEKLEQSCELWRRNGLHLSEKGFAIPLDTLAKQEPDVRMARSAAFISVAMFLAGNLYWSPPEPDTIQSWNVVKEVLHRDGIRIPQNGPGLWLNVFSPSQIHLIPVNGNRTRESREVALPLDFQKWDAFMVGKALTHIEQMDVPVITRRAKTFGLLPGATRDGQIATSTIAVLRQRRQELAV